MADAISIDGRAASLARRRALSASGKAGVAPGGGEPVQRRRPLPAAKVTAIADDAAPANGARPAAAIGVTTYEAPSQSSVRYASLSARDQARARRANISRIGRGDAAPTLPTRPPRNAQQPAFAPQPVVTEAQEVRRQNGVRVERVGLVTGAERGLAQPISGTQYDDRAVAAQSAKVGFAQTPGGSIVSGSLVRSKVRVTGDERGGAIAVTGEADQRVDDDVTQRTDDGAVAATQFRRQVNPHGFATPPNIARSVRSFGSRERDRRLGGEPTNGDLPVTGSAPSGGMVTGDDVSGSGRSPGRRVSVSQTWRGRPLTGIDVEQHERVSGNASGAYASVSGSPYQNNGAVDRRGDADPSVRVSGDIPRNVGTVTGTARGATRAISGTPYYRGSEPESEPLAKPVAAIEERFSVRSPQRAAHLRGEHEAQNEKGARRITGSFAVGTGKVTGNLEFVFRPRSSAEKGDGSGRLRLTGEGRSVGRAITGEAWSQRSNVTGTEGEFAASRNPSERAAGPKPFAGNGRFKELANKEEPKHLVTGMFGYSSDSAAKVTLSGGAQG